VTLTSWHQFAFCFHQSFDESTLKDLQEAYHGSHSFSALLPLLKRSSYPWLALSVDHLLSGTMAQIGHNDSRSMTLRNIGIGWIALSRFFMDLYVPNTPLDPAASQSSRSEFWGAELASLSHELELETDLERRICGNTTNCTIQYLDKQIRHVREHLHHIPHVPRTAGSDVLRLREFWSEISQFMLKIVPESRLKNLIDAFHGNSPGASANEHVIQESIARFHQRLESVYPEFDDISRPLTSALLYLRFGLRLVVHASACGEAAVIENSSHALAAFPSVRGATALVAGDSRGDLRAVERSPFDSVLLVLTAVAFEVELGVDVQSRIAAIESVYERAARLWLIDQKKQEEADIASQSLYRTNRISHDARIESELEEEDFLALFPDYESLFDRDHSQESEPDHIPRQSLSSDASFASSLMLLHLRIMSPGSHPSDAQTRLSDLRAALLASILDKYKNNLPETLDDHCFPHQLSLLAARLQSLHHHDNLKAPVPYNFYIGSHVPEIRKAAALVESLKSALDALIQEWPDQMVLQHLRDRCAQILSLSAQSPVAKVLVLLEQLLLQTDDWEMYASQETTLKSHRNAITELVISWRRLELSSWRGLLQTQAVTFEEGASEWWFRLYNTVIRGLLDIVDHDRSDSLDEYLGQLVPLLDDFLKSSPLGQFSRRLELLRSFEPLLQHLTVIKSERAREPLNRVQRIVHSTQAYYTQFISSITSWFTAQEKAISEEIQSFIKIASWKDVNVQALKASAKKTHHQLHKVIRKYREIMRQPVNDFLRPERIPDTVLLSNARLSPSYMRAKTVDSSNLPTHLTAGDGPAHLRDLSKTYRKFDTLITSRIDFFFGSVPSHSLDNLTEQMTSTAKELASVSLPVGATTGRREKLWKAALVRKRKAWSDFAKEFKRIGLATNVQSTVLLQLKNDRWLREQPFPDIGVDNFAAVQHSEQYFVRLQCLLPRLRDTLGNHHGDISGQELQRSVMLLESALSVSLNCRSKFVRSRIGCSLANKDFYEG
jgi:midasin